MSRDPGEGPDEDGTPDDQPAERAAEPDAGGTNSDDDEAEDGSGPTIHHLDADQEDPDDGSAGADPDEQERAEAGNETTEAAEPGTDPSDDEAGDGGRDDGDEEGGGEESDEDADPAGEHEPEGSDAGERDSGGHESEDDGEEGEDGTEASDEDDGSDGEAETAESDEGDESDGEDGAEARDDGDEDADDDDEGESDEDEEGSEPTTTPLERKTGPTEDQEQPLTEHIEEMVKRVAIVLVIAGLVSLIAFPYGEEFINFLWYSVLPSDISKPHVYHPLELVITQLKAASLLGVVIALPVFVYQTYAFMRPGLYPHERRYYLSAVPTSLVLAFVGLLFGYFLVLPTVMTYFMQYSRDVVDIAFALGETFTLMLVLLAFLAVVFQIPLFIMLAIMMGLTTRNWLEEKRLIMWGVFLGIAFLFSPDPTGMAPFLIALTMVGLYEGTLLLLRWTGRGGR